MDMSGMNMSSMNMSGMNMSTLSSSNTNMTTDMISNSVNGMSMSDNMCMVMLNGYQFSLGAADNCVLFLFPFSPVNTQVRYAAAVIGTFLLCIAFEFLRATRDRMIKKKAPFGFLKSQPELTMDMVSAVSYGLQVWIGYWIMLLVMLYEAFIFIAIVSGVATGYFLVLRVGRSLDRQYQVAQNNESDQLVHCSDQESEGDFATKSAPPTPCCAPP